MSKLCIFTVLCLVALSNPLKNLFANEFEPLPVSNLHSASRQNTANTFRTSDVTASTFSEERPVDPSLFGPLRDLIASPSELKPYVHPRIVVGPSEWDQLLSMYAKPQTFNSPGTWSSFFRSVTVNHGLNPFILELADLEATGGTSAYKAVRYNNTLAYQNYRNELLPLASRITMSNAGNSDAFPLCSLWASVAQKQVDMGSSPFIPVNTSRICIRAALAWSKIILAHRTYHCNPNCPIKGPKYAFLWANRRGFSIHHNWILGGTGIAFTYDLLFPHITAAERVIMRSALAMFSLNRWAWGTSDTSSRRSPNAQMSPHRIFSNWAGYNSNLYLANLAIEGEEGYDEYATSVLNAAGKASGFNQVLHERYSALLEAFMTHSFYPDGSTFEDGYSYFTALREGSLGLLASHRRGSNILGTARFRNIIHNAAQMFEPWQCGKLIGHASGGGNRYNSYVGLFRYVYPSGELPGMLWRQRYGNYRNNRPCRIFWTQSVLQLMFLGGEHISTAEAPSGIDDDLQQHFKLSFYSTRRGLLIARAGLSQNATYVHFDARPDGFLVGHDNADRGVFTFSALRQTWFDDLPWASNVESRKHSLLHVDGLAQDARSPSGKMLKVEDNGHVVIAAADLTYTYNVQWARNFNYKTAPTQIVTVYDQHGIKSNVKMTFTERELNDPWSIGWPVDDRAADIGLDNDTKLHYKNDVGFMGIWLWKRNYRDKMLSHVVRSCVLVRPQNDEIGYGMVVDSASVGAGRHVFESYLILHRSVSLLDSESWCLANTCRITLTANDEKYVDLHVLSLGTELSFRTEIFGTSKMRLIIKSLRDEGEELWLVMHPHNGNRREFSVVRNMDRSMKIGYNGDQSSFVVDGANNSVKRLSV